jgi:hydroxyacylglutathione hydrolase
MILKRFYEDKLAQASFMVGDPAAGEAVVIDPNRDVETYLRAAESEGLRITAVTETHIHADFVSGSRDLAARSGARLYVSDEGGEDWKYAFAGEPDVVPVRDGDEFRAGVVRLRVVHTPGHTPEHISLLLTDGAATDQPLGAFTGDFIFVGDVGRPDLLERAAHQVGTMEHSARTLFRSLQRFKQLPGHLMLWPSHGAGSACGKHLGGVPVTTLAYEMLVNAALRETDEQAFVRDVLAGLPDPPRYFGEMKRLNRLGAPRIDVFRAPPRLDPESALRVVESGAVVVDLRRPAEFAKAFIPGVLHLPSGPIFTTWAGWLRPYDRPIYLLGGHESEVAASARDLALIGIDDVRGWMTTSTVLNRWLDRHGEPETMVRVGFEEALDRAQRGAAVLLDVRERGEYAEGHAPGAVHIPLGQLAQRASELSAELPIAVHCASGTRSPIAVSLLRRLGYTHLADVTGGFAEYAASGRPVETGEPTDVATG